MGLSLCFGSLREGPLGSSGSTFFSHETHVSWGSLQPNTFTKKSTRGNSEGCRGEGGAQGRWAENLCWRACVVLKQRATERLQSKHVLLDSSAEQAYTTCKLRHAAYTSRTQRTPSCNRLS